MVDPEKITDEIADQAERLVDTRGISYDDAYRQLGVPQSTGASTPANSAREAAHAYYTEEFNLTGTRTPEEASEAARAAVAGAQLARQALGNKRPPEA